MSLITSLFESLKVKGKPTQIICENFEMVKGETKSLKAGLVDGNDNPLPNKTLNIIINGKAYPITTNAQGEVELPITLNPGAYDVHFRFNYDGEYRKATSYCTITVNTKIITNNLSMAFNDGHSFTAKVTDYNNKVLPNIPVNFTVNKKTYAIKSDSNGEAKLKIGLAPGKYTINTNQGSQNINNTIQIGKGATFIDCGDASIQEGQGGTLNAAVYNTSARIISDVTFQINNQKWIVKSDNEGLYKLDLQSTKIQQGNYNLKVSYDGNKYYNACSKTVKLNVEKQIDHVSQTTEFLQQFADAVGSDFDTYVEAYNLIIGRVYSGYSDDVYTRSQALDRLKNKQGLNCSDICQLMHKVAEDMGYDVHYNHIMCQCGVGHIRLKVKGLDLGDSWILIDPAAALTEGYSFGEVWCSNPAYTMSDSDNETWLIYDDGQ